MLLSLAPACLGLVGCDTTETDATTLAGAYQRSHQAFVFHGFEAERVEIEDKLIMTVATDGGLVFTLVLRGLDASRCEVQGVASSKRGFFEHQRPQEACTLRFRAESTGVAVEDVDSRCQETLCGIASQGEWLSFSRL